MSKYKTETSPEVVSESDKIAKATQRPGQTKEQTKLIAQGIQKGIELYKKNNKAKARELDKKLKNIKHSKNKSDNASEIEVAVKPNKKLTWLTVIPWFLLIGSWAYFILVETDSL